MMFGFIGSEQEWRQIRSFAKTSRVVQFSKLYLDQDSDTGLDLAKTASECEAIGAVRVQHFEEFLSNSELQAVVVGGNLADRPERLRLLTQQGKHCLSLHPVASNCIVYHELAMTAADTRSVLMPWFPLRRHPAWIEFLSLCRPLDLGPLQYIRVERSGRLANGQLLVLKDYAEAVDLATCLTGEISEVNATGDPSTGRLVVHHRAAAGVDCEVRLVHAMPADGWRIHVEGTTGRVDLAIDEDTGRAVLKLGESNQAREFVCGPDELVAALFGEFVRAIALSPHAPTWSDAVRAAELADCCQYSLGRRRAVDVYQEKRNEVASFKGRMTSIGCGLIWLTLFLLIVVAAGKGLHVPGIDWVAIATAVIWLVFLAVQSLRWILPGNRGDERTSLPGSITNHK